MFFLGRAFPGISFRPRFAAPGRRWLALAVVLCPALALAHGTFHDRLAALKARLALTPDDAGIHFNLAELYCEHEEPTPALAALERAEALAPGKLPVEYLRGMCLRLAGRPAEALAALDRFVAAHPENSPARLQRARVHAALDNIPASLEDYRAALRLSARPEPDLVQETADALAAHGSRDEAVQVLDAGLARLGPVPSLTLRALDLETATGRFDAALTRVDALQKTAPRPEPWMAKRAALLAQAGRTGEARAAWTALRDHLAALPNLERGSHSMSLLAGQANRALAAP
jgi:tetratricopeptide (TPR) repeat protein